MEHEYTKESHLKFIKDMEKSGIPWEHYKGRWFWEGPAVRTSSVETEDTEEALQVIMGSTKVPLQRDNMGLGWVLYPRG